MDNNLPKAISKSLYCHKSHRKKTKISKTFLICDNPQERKKKKKKKKQKTKSEKKTKTTQ